MDLQGITIGQRLLLTRRDVVEVVAIVNTVPDVLILVNKRSEVLAVLPEALQENLVVNRPPLLGREEPR